MEQRDVKKILLLAIVILLVGALFLFLRRSSDDAPDAAGASDGAVPVAPGTLSRSGAFDPTAMEPSVNPPPPAPAQAVRQVAMTFAERYGSFSSEGDFVNIEDLYAMMTDRFRADRAAFIAAQRAAVGSTAFRATRTVIVNAQVTLDGGDATTAARADVATMRTESASDGAETRTYAQTLTVKLFKVGERWLVDDARWEPVE